MNIVTIDRNPQHSPQMQESDAAIMRSIEKELAAMGAEVKSTSEKGPVPPQHSIILHMSRTAETLQHLEELEAQGALVINSPRAVKNSSRATMVKILQSNNIPQPPYKIVTHANELQEIPCPAWIKKGEGWACRKEDVAFVTNSTEAQAAFETMKANGCSSAVICKHIEGDIIKFYGVAGGFFHHLYPNIETTKFGLEKINGTQKRYPFSTMLLKSAAFDAARALGLDIFGGDAIITPKGEIYIIDINDFPSFSAVRQEAAKEIATMLIKKASKSYDRRG